MFWCALSLTAVILSVPEPIQCSEVGAVVGAADQSSGTVIVRVTVPLPLGAHVEVALVATVLPSPAVHVQSRHHVCVYHDLLH